MNMISELRDAAKSSGMTQAELAKRLNIAQPCVCRFLKGGGLRADAFVLLLDAMGYKISKIRKSGLK